MVTSLKPVLASPYFKALDMKDQLQVLDAFWRGLRNLMQDAFDPTRRCSESLWKSCKEMIGMPVLSRAWISGVPVPTAPPAPTAAAPAAGC
jgi:hypothetical protein